MIIEVFYKWFLYFFSSNSLLEVVKVKLEKETATEILLELINTKKLHIYPQNVYDTLPTERESIINKNQELKDVINLLIQNGADPYYQIKGRSAIELAEKLNLCGHLAEKECPHGSIEISNCVKFAFNNPSIGPVFWHPCEETLSMVLIETYENNY